MDSDKCASFMQCIIWGSLIGIWVLSSAKRSLNIGPFSWLSQKFGFHKIVKNASKEKSLNKWVRVFWSSSTSVQTNLRFQYSPHPHYTSLTGMIWIRTIAVDIKSSKPHRFLQFPCYQSESWPLHFNIQRVVRLVPDSFWNWHTKINKYCSQSSMLHDISRMIKPLKFSKFQKWTKRGNMLLNFDQLLHMFVNV